LELTSNLKATPESAGAGKARSVSFDRKLGKARLHSRNARRGVAPNIAKPATKVLFGELSNASLASTTFSSLPSPEGQPRVSARRRPINQLPTSFPIGPVVPVWRIVHGGNSGRAKRLRIGRISMKAMLAIAALVVAAPALAAPPTGFDQHVEALRQQIGVPGMALAIVENGKITEARGFGVRAMGSSAPAGASTLFYIGSTTKAFTSAALAQLVDQGKIGWDDKVIDRLPGFQMYDPWVTREITIRDLLVHRSGLGLGAGDLLFVPTSNRTRAETVASLRYIKPATSFRSGYAYDNILYMVAGQVIEAVTGQKWEDYVDDHVLKTAGMRNSTTRSSRRLATVDRARPHGRIDGAIRGMGVQTMLDETAASLGENSAPAGSSMMVSAQDMGRWLQIQLAHGKLPDSDGRLFSAAASDQMWSPVVIIPGRAMPPPLQAETAMFQTYALGWDVHDYKGAKIVSHSGAVFGSQAIVVMIPEKNIGFAMMINSEDGEILKGLTNELLDHFLARPTQDWTADYIAFKKKRLAQAAAMMSAPEAQPVAIGPSLPLARYAGSYVDPWYGPMKISQVQNGLRIDFERSPGLSGRLEHRQYDTFRTMWDNPAYEKADVTFGLDAQGKVAQITMKAASPLADFSWDYQDLHFTPVEASK
jgi:CubicO group peptidase (beta-lactamase class C family)